MAMQSIDTDSRRKARLAEFKAADRDAEISADEAGKNRNFVQVYTKGWRRLQQLIRTNPAAARIYAFLAENIDGDAGAFVCSQDAMASEMGVHVITIKRQTKWLENAGAIVRIRIGTGVYAYCLDPEEIWRSWNTSKESAAFLTKTLVRKTDKANNQVKRKLKLMLDGPELPLE